ncbi:MAG: Lrp/AsnC family transcriptional regulator [Vicinamibacterales bacterium]
MNRSKLDATDLKILRLLQQDAELSMQQLAEKVGLSHTPCWRRYIRLKKEGVLLGKVARVDGKKLGKDVYVTCRVGLEKHDEKTLAAFERAVLSFPEILVCFAVAGRKDYVLLVAVSHSEEYDQFLRTSLLHLPGVATIETSFAIRTVKLSLALPI